MDELDLRQINTAVEYLKNNFIDLSFNEYGESVINISMIDSVRETEDFITYLKSKDPTADLREYGIPEKWLAYLEGSYHIRRSSFYDFSVLERWTPIF